MKVIPPISLTDAMITSSTVAEPSPGETVWLAATTFVKGQYCIVGTPSLAVTINNSTPNAASITWAAHSLPNGTQVLFTTAGTLPAGLLPNILYYVIAALAGSFQASLTLGGAPVVTTSGGSGVHTATAYIHRTYLSLADANTGNNPTLAASSAWWFDAGPTNKMAMFDLLRNTQSIGPSPLTVVIAPGQRVNSLAILKTNANLLAVTGTSVMGGGTVYSNTIVLDSRVVIDGYTYCFTPFSTNPNTVLFDIPPFSDIILTVTLTSTAGGNVSCGACIVGTSVFVGTAEYGAVADRTNFSTVTRDLFGNSTLVRRPNVPKTNQKVFLDKAIVNIVLAAIDAIGSMPAVWSGLDDPTDGYANALLILGIIKNSPMALDYMDKAHLTLELEEV